MNLSAALFRRNRQHGSALLVIIPIVLIVGVIIVSMATFSRRQRTEGGKQARQQSAAAAVESRLGAVMTAGRQLMESDGELRMDRWVAAGQEAGRNEVTGGYLPTAATVDGSGTFLRPPAVAAMSSLSSNPGSMLTGLDDPFRGARAFVLPSTLVVEADRTNAALTLGDEGTGQLAGRVQWRALTNMRAIPLSQYGYFAGGAASLDATSFPAGVGRVYVGGDATVTGAVSSDYRAVVGGNAEVASGSRLVARTSPENTAQTTLDSSSRDPRWRNELRPIDSERAVVTGGDLPTTVAVPATAAEMLATPNTDLGDKNIYKFSTQAERVVRLTSFNALTGIYTFVVTDAVGQVVTNPGPWRASSDPRNPSGPVIEFAYAEHYGANTLARSYYVQSDVPGALLLVRQTRILRGPLSVASPLPVSVVNGLGDLTPGPGPNDPPLHLDQPAYPVSVVPGTGGIAVWYE